MAALEELSAAVAKVVGVASSGVVGIGGRWRRGSGLVVADGRVLTNAHNVHHEEVSCVFADGRSARGRVTGVDIEGDLAVIEVDTAGAAVPAWADPSKISIGTPVFALASAQTGVRATVGLVSGVERSFRGPNGRLIGGSIEHTAPMAPGSSGSPILDGEGRVLGLNTQRIGEGFYLAMPADESLRSRIEALARGETPFRPRLGVAVAPGHVARHLRRAVGLPDRDGVLVRAVEEGSPAQKAGIREGDLIVSANGASIGDPDQLHDALAKAGGTFAVGVVRGVEELTLNVDLGGEASRKPN